jgi:hypothetical protein
MSYRYRHQTGSAIFAVPAERDLAVLGCLPPSVFIGILDSSQRKCQHEAAGRVR